MEHGNDINLAVHQRTDGTQIQQNVFGCKAKKWEWIDGSAVKSAPCCTGGLELSSQRPHEEAHNHLLYLLFQGI